MQELKQSAAVVVRLGSFVDMTDGVTPETGITLAAADQAVLFRHGITSAISLANVASMAAVTGDDGWYNLSLAASAVNTLGTLSVNVQDEGTTLPVFRDYAVVTANYWDSKYSTDYRHVDVIQVGGTSQTANDNGADINAILVDTAAMEATVEKGVKDQLGLATGTTTGGSTTHLTANTITPDWPLDGSWNNATILIEGVNTYLAGVRKITTVTYSGGYTINFTPALPSAVTSGKSFTIFPFGCSTYQTGDSFARIGAAGAGLTAIDLPNQTMNITGDITGNLSGSVGSVTAGVTLANDAITLAKFDEATAWPLQRADSGSSLVGRTGADADTLETVSDQIDGLSTGTSATDIANRVWDGTVAARSITAFTTLETKVNAIQGASFNSANNSLYAIRTRGDAAWTGTGSATTIAQRTWDGTVALASRTAALGNVAHGGAASTITLSDYSDFQGGSGTSATTIATRTWDGTVALASRTVNMEQISGTTLSETSSGNISGNFSTFYDNADAVTIKTVDDVGGGAATIPPRIE